MSDKFVLSDVSDGDYFLLARDVFVITRPKVYFSYSSILYIVTYAGECENQLEELKPEELKGLNLKENTPILVLDIWGK